MLFALILRLPPPLYPLTLEVAMALILPLYSCYPYTPMLTTPIPLTMGGHGVLLEQERPSYPYPHPNPYATYPYP